MINPGQYKAKAIKGSVQLGETENGTLQIAIDMDIKGPDGKSIGAMTTFMYFSTGAAPYSYERLRALGWKGNGPEDIGKMDSIDANEVDVRVTVPEQYRAADGAIKMGQSKLEILTGGGQVKITKPLDQSTFMARLKAVGGPGGGGTAPAGGSGGPPPPF